MKKVLYITILACSTLWGSCTEKNKQSARTDSFIEKNVAFARAQIGNEIQIIEKSEKFINPVTLKTDGSPDKPGGLSIQLCKSEKKEFYIRYSS